MMQKEIPQKEWLVTDEQVFSGFDLDDPGMEAVKRALEKNDAAGAKQALADHFHRRAAPHFLFDYRGLPLKPIDPNEAPYSFQSSLGFKGDLKAHCLQVAEKMMHNIYLLPGGDRGEHDLGPELEHMIHFNFLEDQGKRHRHTLDMFVRGQFFECLAIRYHDTGDEAVVRQFVRIFNRFFQVYGLDVVDTRPSTDRFQYTEDRDVMSVGWLTVVLTSLLYTELPYAAGPELVFELLRHVWFLGMQFRRFDHDGYRPYNHHMWERGLVPFILDTMYPEIPAFAQMRDHGAQVVRRHVKEDFNGHGGYSEHSVAYWSGAAIGEMLARGVYLARLNGLPLLDDDAQTRFDKTFSALAAIAFPGRFYPSIGDNGGPLIDPILKLGAVTTGNAACAALLAFRQGDRSREKELTLDYCDDLVGFAAARNSYGPEGTCWVMSAKVRCGSSGHNHMDMLSLAMVVRGVPFYGEPHTRALYHQIRMNTDLRGFMYNMESHNSVLAYGRPICGNEVYQNQWGVYRPDSPVTAWRTGPEGVYLSAYHDGYTYCRHIRTLLYARRGAMWVHDAIDRGNRLPQPHIQRWNLEPGVQVRRLADDVMLLEKDGVSMLWVWYGVDRLELSRPIRLVPEIVQDEDQLGWVLDAVFSKRADSSRNVSQRLVPVDLIQLDVTGRSMPDLDAVRTLMRERCECMEEEKTLEQLAQL